MGKIKGYIVAVLGLIVIILSFNSYVKAFLEGFKMPVSYFMIIGIVLLIFGVVLSTSGRHVKQHEEVPIYEGDGKKRRIVGYRKPHTN